MAGLVNATLNENLLWNIERTVTNVFIPLLNANGMGDKAGLKMLTNFLYRSSKNAPDATESVC
jgi:hypothetical protein